MQVFLAYDPFRKLLKNKRRNKSLKFWNLFLLFSFLNACTLM